MEGLKLAELVNDEILRGASSDKADKRVKDYDMFEKEILSQPTIHYYTLDDTVACHPQISEEKVKDIKNLIQKKYNLCAVNISNGSQFFECAPLGNLQSRLDEEKKNLQDHKFFNYYNPFMKMTGEGKKKLAKTIIYDTAFLSCMSFAVAHERPVLSCLILGVAYFGDSERRKTLNLAKKKVVAFEKELVPYNNFKENLNNATIKIHYSAKVIERMNKIRETFNESEYYKFDCDRINMGLLSLYGLLFTNTNISDWH